MSRDRQRRCKDLMLECHKLQFYSTAQVSGKVVTTTTKSNASGLKEVKTMYCHILQHLWNAMHTDTPAVYSSLTFLIARTRTHTAFPSCRASTTTSRSAGAQCAWAVSSNRLNTLSDAHACGTTARTPWVRSDASRLSFLRYHRVCPHWTHTVLCRASPRQPMQFHARCCLSPIAPTSEIVCMYIQTQAEDKDSPHWQALREAVRRHKNLNQAHDIQLPEAVGVYSFGPDRKDSSSLHRRAAAAK